MDGRRPRELVIVASVLLAIGIVIVAWDATFVVFPLVGRIAGPEGELSAAPTPLHNLRTIMTGVFAMALAVGLLRCRAWARRAVVAAGWISAVALGAVMAVAPFSGSGRFVIELGALIPFVNAPYLLLCQVLGALVEAEKIEFGFGASLAVGLAGAVVLPAATAICFSTARLRRAFGGDRLHVATLVRRELGAYFHSPIAYVVAAVFLFIVGVYYVVVVNSTLEASMRLVFLWMGWVLLFIAPFLTMRLLAEERRSGTIEMLLSAPVTDVEVVASKFLGALAFFAVMLLPTGALVLVLRRFGTPDMGPIVTGYIGVFMLGGYLVAFGLLASALARNQIVAGAVAMIATMAIAILARMVDPKSVVVASSASDRIRRLAYRFVEYLGMMQHLDSFIKGVFDQKDFFFYIAFTFLWLYLAVRALESRRWRY